MRAFRVRARGGGRARRGGRRDRPRLHERPRRQAVARRRRSPPRPGSRSSLAGLVALWRRPENATGFLLAATGYLWFVAALTEAERRRGSGRSGSSSGTSPSSRFAALDPRLPRRGAEPARPLARRRRRRRGDPRRTWSAALVDRTAGDRMRRVPAERDRGRRQRRRARRGRSCVGSVVVGVVLLWIAVILVRRWRRRLGDAAPDAPPGLPRVRGSARPPARRGRRSTRSSSRAYSVVWVLFLIAFAAVPLTFLAGVLRSRFDRAAAARMLVSLDAGVPLRDALADALHDPSLEIVYRLGEREGWVDEDGPRRRRARRHRRARGDDDRARRPPDRRARPRPVARRRARTRSSSSPPQPACRSRTRGSRPTCARSSSFLVTLVEHGAEPLRPPRHRTVGS